ncbi:MAG: class I SAM-dependent methyltransferase [Phycisphaerae bacterium]|nr:class I SAM-dependent methyltransferase [Phycisphaerae bacterium]
MPRAAPTQDRSARFGARGRPEGDLYAVPMLYDVLHTPGTAEEVAGLARIARRFVVGGGDPMGTWLEPACGTGRYLRVASRRVRSAVGFDMSAEMVEYARGRSRRGANPPRYFVARMEDFAGGVRAGSVDFAFNPINTIRHLESDAALLAHLSAVARVLRPGGVYAVGISLCAYGREGPTEDVWRGVRGRLRVTQTVQYLPASAGSRATRNEGGRFERVISHLHVVRGGVEQHVDSTYRLRGYSARQWEEVVSRSRLRIVGAVDDRGRDAVPTEPGYGVYVLGRATR